MEQILVFFVFIIFIALILVPVILLVKISSIHRELKQSNSRMTEFGEKLDAMAVLIAAPAETTPAGTTPAETAPAGTAPAETAAAVKTDSLPIETETAIQIKIAPPPIPDHILQAERAKANPSLYAAPPTIEQPEVIQPETIVASSQTDISAQQPEQPETIREKSMFIKFLTENVLTKIGIVTLVLGIGFFVKYAIDQNWINEIGRVGIGLLTGSLIIGIAHKLRAKYELFSSILVGGGIAVYYITITLAFREYSLFSQPVAFAILTGITIFSVLLSLFYNRVELAVFSLLGGFAAPLMVSTGVGNYIVLFSYLFVLNTSMLVLAYLKNWRILGVIAYALTVFFCWRWLLYTFEKEYTGATIFVSLFFVQFYLLALFDHYKTKYKITLYQVLLISTLNLLAFMACLHVFAGYGENLRGVITACMAGVNVIVMLVVIFKSAMDRNLLYLVRAIVLTFISLIIPMQFNGHVITMFWTAEMCILLFLWQKSRIRIFQAAFLIISLLVLISYGMDVENTYFLWGAAYLPVITNRICMTGLVVIAGFGLCLWLLKREDPASEVRYKYPGFSLKTGFIQRIFQLTLIAVTFVVPFWELDYQVSRLFDYNQITSFRFFVLAIYIFMYIAVLCLIYFRKAAFLTLRYSLFSFALIMYVTIYAALACDLRYDIFVSMLFPANYFLCHFISVPAIGILMFYLVKKIREQRLCKYMYISWFIVFVGVVILSIELDHAMTVLLVNPDNYYDILYDAHTIGYPILWGCLAFILMVWGLRAKEVVLRQISLFIFGTTIVKFYAYDVWNMSQAGRIISFVVLGILLLVVSFLQQKIKVLVKDNNPQSNTPNA